MGIEPTSEAWEASILPLNYARTAVKRTDSITSPNGPQTLCITNEFRCCGSPSQQAMSDSRFAERQRNWLRFARLFVRNGAKKASWPGISKAFRQTTVLPNAFLACLRA